MPCPLCEFWEMLELNDLDVVMDKWQCDMKKDEFMIICEKCAKDITEQVQTIEEESK